MIKRYHFKMKDRTIPIIHFLSNNFIAFNFQKDVKDPGEILICKLELLRIINLDTGNEVSKEELKYFDFQIEFDSKVVFDSESIISDDEYFKKLYQLSNFQVN